MCLHNNVTISWEQDFAYLDRVPIARVRLLVVCVDCEDSFEYELWDGMIAHFVFPSDGQGSYPSNSPAPQAGVPRAQNLHLRLP
jgi:hypothetical protein